MSRRAALVAALAALVLAGLAFGIGGASFVDVAERRLLDAAQRDLQRAVEHGLSRHRVAQLELAQLAQRLARAELTPRMGLVVDEAERLAALAARIRRAVPGPSDDPAVVRLRRARIALDEDAVPAFARLWAARLGAAGPAAEADARAFVAECLAVDLDACLHLAAREPLVAEMSALTSTPGAGPRAPDVALVVDARGIGRADARAPTWTGAGGLTAELPVLAEALTSRAIVRDVGRVPGRSGVHLLVAAPLLEGETLRGAVLVGVALDGHRLAADAAAVGYDLTWTIAGTLGASASTLPVTDLPELDGARFLTARAAVPGNVSATPILVASLPRERALGPLAGARASLWLLVGVSVTLLGLALLVSRSGMPGRQAEGARDRAAGG